MAENNVRMSPVQTRNDGQRRQKEGRVQTNRATEVATGLNPTAGRVNSYTGTVARTENTKAADLARALGALSPSLNSLANTVQTKTDNDYLNSAEYHMNRIRDELGTGVVTAVQAGEMLPEASHTVVAKITQAMGKQYAKDFFAEHAEKIQMDDNLRLNTAARNEYLAKVKAEAQAFTEDPFYLSGVTEGLDAQINQYEQRWLMETAEYQKGIIKEDTVATISDLLMSNGDLEAWDTTEKQVSPLTNLERNALVTETAINLALETRDPTLLKNVPERFLNAKTKREFAQAETQIQSAKYTEWSQNRTMAEEQRKLDIRAGKVGIINEFIGNGRVDPTKYRYEPELYAYALSMGTKPKVDALSSKVNVNRLRNGLVKAAMTGDVEGTLGQLGYQGDLNEDSIYAFLLNNDMINTDDAAAILDEVPKLLEGQAVLQDAAVKDSLTNVLRPQLDALRQSPNANLQKLLVGNAVESQVISFYETDISESFYAYYEDTGQWPKGVEKLRLVREARTNALNVMKELTNVNNIGTTADEAIEKVTKPEAKRFNPNTGKME